MKRRFSPVARLSIGLAALTISLLLGAEMLGLLPDQDRSALAARQKICESLALQLSWAAIRNDRRSIQATLDLVVSNNPDILSVALKSRRSGTVIEVGNHNVHWTPSEDGRSTPTDVQVPIFSDRGQWGVLELSFEPLRSPYRLSTWVQSKVGLLLFVGCTGFLVFFLFLRRALRELDPSRVIPDHVKAAFDALTEGVLIMDEEERIVLANNSFIRLTGSESRELTGRKASELGWSLPTSDDGDSETVIILPWQLALVNGAAQTGVPLLLPGPSGEIRTFMVNGAPITDGEGKTRGALATFDDVSELQKKNTELRYTLEHLEKSKEKVKRQNQELQFLATRDPLTRCLNRRAMFQKFEKLFEEARLESEPLCCMMIDIDHFKSFNDRYGHAAGDKVIKFVAKALRSASRTVDLVARYGGEEFCIMLPGLDLEASVAVAERVRMTISQDFSERFTTNRDLTVSIGVASLLDHTDTLAELVNRADKALYSAKGGGRNRVVKWGDHDDTPAGYQGQDTEPQATDADQSMLVEKIEEVTQTLQVLALNERVMELDAMVEEKSGELHRKHGFDKLTGLPMRILFYDRVLQSLSAAQREGNAVAVLYLDIDLLQRDGDVLEPVMGDQLLKAVSERMTAVLRGTDNLTPLANEAEERTLSRLGNNEFGIVLGDLTSTESVTWVIQRLFESLDDPIQADGNEVYANCSAGIGLYPSDGEDVETLVRCASRARHHAQAGQGRHNFLFFGEDMNKRSYQQMQLESQLRDALTRNEFILHYQPMYDVQTGRISALEALIRWNNPETGLVGPDMFIPIAEQTGLITQIGEWVLREACQQMKQWTDAGVDNLRIAVNLSAVQLRSAGLYESIFTILEETGLHPKCLELEVTETALMDSVTSANDALQKLRAHGVHIAIDDFGTGFSSLSHLKHLIVDKLKIDHSFVRDVTTDQRDAAVVSSIIAMAKLMGMCVVAEGVETQKQLEFLRKRQCDMVQGYLFSRPLPADDVEPLLLVQHNPDDVTTKSRRHETQSVELAAGTTSPTLITTAE